MSRMNEGRKILFDCVYEAMRRFYREILIVGPGIVTAVEMADYLRRDRDDA